MRGGLAPSGSSRPDLTAPVTGMTRRDRWGDWQSVHGSQQVEN